ncbi:MAG TPA: hypothetical protein ENL46_03470 [Candidatus Aminicenantes bacterium]|nr:hypothetical protein [Candidatus Aminicenantes bacterium]
MKKKTIFILLCFFLLFTSHILSQETLPDNSNDAELETILEKCADYCEKIRSLALYFVFKEKIVEHQYAEMPREKKDRVIRHGLGDGPRKITIRLNHFRDVYRYVYDYQLICKLYTNKVMEKRILLSENYEKKHEKNSELKTRFHHSQLLLAPIAFFGRSHQADYDYNIIGREKHYVDEEIVIEAIPKSHAKENRMHGKAWISVSEDNFSITKIEWTSDSVENMDAIEIEARFLQARPEIKCSVEFKHRIKDIRFPNKYSLIEAYYHNNRKLYNRTEITVRYEDYRFFSVSTEVKGDGAYQ